MSDYAIRAIERKEKPKVVRRNGFIPGVIYGKNYKSENVKFEEKKFLKLLSTHSQKAKIKVKINDEIKLCLIKEIQKDPVLEKIIHVAMRIVNEHDLVKQKVPIIFQGQEELAKNNLIVQVLIPEAEISGKAAEIPEAIYINIKDKKPGEKVTVADINVGPSLKVMDDPNKTYAIILTSKEYAD